MRAAYPWHVRIRRLAPSEAYSVSVSGSDGHQAALLLDSTGWRHCVCVGTQGLASVPNGSAVARSLRDWSVFGIRVHVRGWPHDPEWRAKARPGAIPVGAREREAQARA